MNQKRIARLAAALREKQIDWLALVPSTSLVYLTGIHSHVSERPFVVFLSADNPPAAIIPVLEAVKGEKAGIPSARIFAWSDQDGYMGAFQQAAQTLGLSSATVGVEALKMRVLELDVLSEMASGVKMMHADSVTDALRLSKDADEIAVLQKAAQVAEAAMADFLPSIKIGMTEKAIAAKLSQAIMDAGADALTFRPIVSAGPNGASPHAVPTNRPIQAGDLLILDWGARIGEYVSDITRTFAVGKIDDESHNIYAAVRAANAAGVAACRPNVSGEAIDRAARAEIERAGYGEYFIHRTGHGLGMEAHESPSLVEGNSNPLPVGACFTVEPGVYVPGKGGVRIEDDIVLTEDGYLSLTTFSRELITVG